MKERFNLKLENTSIIFQKTQSTDILDLNSMIKLLQELKLLGKKVIVYNGAIYTIHEALNLIQETQQFATAAIEEAISQVESQIISKKKDDFVSKDSNTQNATILKQLITDELISEDVLIPNRQELASVSENKAIIPDKTSITGIFIKSISDDESGTLVLGQEQDLPGGGFLIQAYSGTHSDVKIVVDGVQVADWSMNNSTFSNGDIIEDTSGNNHNLTINLNTFSIQVTVSDGYILGATVFADANER